MKKSLKGPVKIFFGQSKVINKLKSRGFRASSLSTYVFSTLYTTLPHNLIKDKLVDLIERIFQREVSLYIACNDRHAFFTSDTVRNQLLQLCTARTAWSDSVIRSETNLITESDRSGPIR